MVFRIFGVSSDGTSLWSETHQDVPVDQGRFQVTLGSQGNPISSVVFAEPTRWIEVEVAGEVLSPRVQLGSVPYAFNADRLNGKTEDELLGGIGGLPTGAVVWFRQASTPPGYARITGALGIDVGPWEHLTDTPDDVNGLDCTACTGSEVLCWDNWERVGARYSLEAHSWAPITSTGAPITRGGYSALWTGAEMLVWGGSYESTYFGDGARYDPIGNSWTPMTTTGAPSPRRQHSTVWTGSEMIVWGGSDYTGGRYDPIGDMWTPVSTLNAPISASGYIAMWTGSAMIVFGRHSDGGFAAAGGRYYPITDTWASLDTALAPRLWDDTWKAAWTGSEMVVTHPDLPHLYLYDPAADSWRRVVYRRQYVPHFQGDYPAPIAVDGLLLTTEGVYDLSEDAWVALGNESIWAYELLWTGNEVLAIGQIGPGHVPILSHRLDLIFPYVRESEVGP